MAARRVSLAARAFGTNAVGPLVALLLLSACGQKGPLTLPKPPAAAAASAPAASAPR
ncbi:LPS translocon maturation chaperone LptM [Piscinibacter sp. HJYY11]|uniref:LPS translocon maturation chaperone LptM n=1 Tax=Piscinibacter sp. HJYY11 TaxID=2801333 RepID=UPI00191F4B1F|nr:lipoprotein [Piscinibacter sp. HJYY11]MBL0728091.1 lipoprotein [Piscinibacter sp. HJYY11]